jgi:hypothetical protein
MKDEVFSMEDNQKRSREDEMSFSDSWKRTSVELALGAAVLAGAADTIIKGKPTSFINGGKDAIKAVGGGLNRYIGKKGTTGQKFLFGVGKKSARNLKNEAKKLEEVKLETLSKKYNATLENDKLKERIYNEANRNLKARGIESPTQDQLDIEMEQIRTKKATTNYGNQKKKDGPFEQAKGNFLGGTATGLGLGAGVTLFHSLDKKLNNNEKNKNKEKSFNLAGSMMKSAGVREIYDGLAGAAGNTPKAIATGVGYTGVSLGTAKFLNDKQQKKEEHKDPKPKNSRIIIELGQEGQEDNTSHATRNTSLSMLPKYKDLQKTASISNFLKNVGGRGSEVTELERRISGQTVNYRDEAAKTLKGQNLNDVVKDRYGNLVVEGSKAMPYKAGKDFFHRELLDSEANLLKRKDQAKLEGVKDDVATARMKGIGGLAGVGAVGGALSSLKKDDKKND